MSSTTATMKGRRRRRLANGAAAGLVLVLVLIRPGVGEAAQQCGTSSGYSICLNAPSGTLSGDVSISVTVSGSSSGISHMDFAWGSTSSNTNSLLSDFQAPWGFVWRTDLYLDGNGWLNVRVTRGGGSPGAPVAMQLTLSNGNSSSVPAHPSDWNQIFQPRASSGDPVVVAVGDGGDGTTRSNALAAYIPQSEASLLLFLGDIYERGTPAEWDYNFGRSSLDPGGGTKWGSMITWTVPTLGNHEGFNIPVWRDYWHGRPNWDTFVYGGVRFLDLNSECTRIGGCGPGSAQYSFVQNTLASNTWPCVVAFWHKPVLSAVADTTAMDPIWALLADGGGDLVLNGHTHTMERYQPMNADLQVGQPDSHMVELVSGAGGHNLTPTMDTDPRNAWQVTKTTGAAYLTLVGGGSGVATALSWEFRDTNGNAIPGSSSSVSCGADMQPPTVPGTPTGESTSPGTIDLTWPASTDDLAVSITYHVYRDGGTTPVGAVTSSSTTTVSFTDTGLAPNSTHTYQVDASDGQNTSGLSDPSNPITVIGSPPPTIVFTDGFDAGLGQWTNVTNLATDSSMYPPQGSAPSVRAAVNGQRAFAYHDLGSPYTSLCLSSEVSLNSVGTSSVALMKLRTADNQSIGRVFVDASRALKVRGDISGAVFSPGVTLPNGWNAIQLCGTIGSSGTWALSLNGTVIGSWTTNNGSDPITRIQIGDETAKTIDVNFDDVVASE